MSELDLRSTDNLKLTNEERQLVKEMLETQAWEILCDKIWNWQGAMLAQQALTVVDDQRYHQGTFYGFLLAERIAKQAAIISTKQPANEQLPELVIFGGKRRGA